MPRQNLVLKIYNNHHVTLYFAFSFQMHFTLFQVLQRFLKEDNLVTHFWSERIAVIRSLYFFTWLKLDGCIAFLQYSIEKLLLL